MRWIFLTLVFGNLLLLTFFWQQQNTVEPTEVTAVELPSEGKTIQLVNELDKTLPSNQQDKKKVKRAQLCYVAGPYADTEQASHLLSRAKSLGFSASINTVEVAGDEPSEYWVYVPPMVSREVAMRTLRELQQRKIDSYIITQGELAEGISIGLFRNKGSAYGLQERIKALSIPVEVRVINKDTQEYWVEIKETSQLNEALRKKIRAKDVNIAWELVECSA